MVAERPWNSIGRPAADRVSRPFRDAYGYFAGLVNAKSENARLRRDVDKWRQQANLNAYAASENTDLRKKLHFVNSRSYPKGYGSVGADIISQPPSAFAQQVVIGAGSDAGIRKFDPVITDHALSLALGRTLQERQTAYRALCQEPLRQSLLQEIRTTGHQSRVLGTEAFKDTIEAALARRVRPGKAGRPRKTPRA